MTVGGMERCRHKPGVSRQKIWHFENVTRNKQREEERMEKV